MIVFNSFLCIFTLFNVMKAESSTHWVVTESSFIEAKTESPFELAHPNDLVAFLNQDKYWGIFVNLYHDLSHRKNVIDKIWTDLEKDVDFDAKIVSNEDCVKSGHLKYLDWYVPFVEEGKSMHVPSQDFLLHKPYKGKAKNVPDCKTMCSLKFGMSLFDHIESMQKRHNLTMDPELGVVSQISPAMSEDQFGHWVTGILRRNSSSWLHYNMASIYWRTKGDAPKALECIRCSVHFAPRKYKDVALFNLGTLLHRCKMSQDAVMILHSAIDHNPKYPIHHFILGNAYAVLGQFQKASNHFDHCLKMYPKFVEAAKHRHGVLCLEYLFLIMKKVQIVIKDLREKLTEYQKVQSDWITIQGAIVKTTKGWDKLDHKTNRIAKICEKMTSLSGFDVRELKKKSDKFMLILVLLQEKFTQEWFNQRGIFETAGSLQFFMKQVEERSESITQFSEREKVDPRGSSGHSNKRILIQVKRKQYKLKQ